MFCDVTLSAYPHRASLKNMPGHGGIRTYDLWNTSPMLFQLSYAVRTVRVSDISEQYLVPSIPMCSSNMNFFSVLVLCTQVNNMFCDVTLSAYPHRASLKNMPGHGGIRTYDLWNTTPMLFQLSYAVRTVRVSDISEQYLVPSIPMCSSNMNFFLFFFLDKLLEHIGIILLEHIGIEGTRYCSEISLTRTVLTA